MPEDLGLEVTPMDFTLWTDAPYVRRLRLTDRNMRTAELRFPALTPPVVWTAIVGGDGVAEFAIPAEDTVDIPTNTPVVLWIDGAPKRSGRVTKRGSLT